MRNIIDALVDIVERNAYQLQSRYIYKKGTTNRVNNEGIAFEDYITNLFSDNLFEDNERRYENKINETFSYVGHTNYPPDLILKGSCAIEVKKSNKVGEIHLNSSYPKDYIYRDSPKIHPGCYKNEDWHQKEMIYALGIVPDNSRISQLCFVYGTEFCANRAVYEAIEHPITSAIQSLEGNDPETKELGSFPSVDLLGYTRLRVRGMWIIQHPLKIFRKIYTPHSDASFNLMALIDKRIFDELTNKDRLLNLASQNNNLRIDIVNIPDPNTQLRKDSVLITYFVR